MNICTIMKCMKRNVFYLFVPRQDIYVSYVNSKKIYSSSIYSNVSMQNECVSIKKTSYLYSKNLGRFVVTNSYPVGLRGAPLNLVDLAFRGSVSEYRILYCSWHLLYVPN